MNILPFQFHHAGVTRELRSGKETIMNASMELRLLNHCSLKNSSSCTMKKHRNTLTH